MTRDIEKSAEILASARSLIVATGAGMSKESGIPTFRDAPSALWANYNPEDLATPEGFLRDPPLVWRWYEERRKMIAKVSPHAGHFAVAELETVYDDFLLVTQNIDNLHREAGSRSIVEFHGNIFRFKCFDQGHPVDTLPQTDEVPPRCECGSLIRPDVVWYGEVPAQENLDRSVSALSVCDAILVVGTSGLVYPAAGFPAMAKREGAKVVEVNPDRTPISQFADVFVEGPAGEVLPVVVALIKKIRKG